MTKFHLFKIPVISTLGTKLTTRVLWLDTLKIYPNCSDPTLRIEEIIVLPSLQTRDDAKLN